MAESYVSVFYGVHYHVGPSNLIMSPPCLSSRETLYPYLSTDGRPTACWQCISVTTRVAKKSRGLVKNILHLVREHEANE